MMFDSVASCPHDAKTSLEAAESLSNCCTDSSLHADFSFS